MFVDECREAGHAVESVCRVLSGQGCQIAARTCRAWVSTDEHVAPRTVGDAIVINAVRDAAWAVAVDADGPMAGVRRLTAEGLYGRRKMTAMIQRTLPEASPGSVDRAMKAMGSSGIRRAKRGAHDDPGKDVRRAGDLPGRDFTAAAPNLGRFSWLIWQPWEGPDRAIRAGHPSGDGNPSSTVDR